VGVAGLYWKWIVSKGRKIGRELGHDYYELHYEDVVEKPAETLVALSDFVGQELDYDRIKQVGIGSVSEPNSSFASVRNFRPVGRWAEQMTPEQLAKIEALIGSFLNELGYRLATSPTPGSREARFRGTYMPWFTLRHWLKSSTPLGRFSSIERMEISATTPD